MSLTSTDIALLSQAQGKGLGAHLTLLRTGHVLGDKEMIIENMQLDALSTAIFPFIRSRVRYNVVSEREKMEIINRKKRQPRVTKILFLPIDGTLENEC